jgi:hypothetical protein
LVQATAQALDYVQKNIPHKNHRYKLIISFIHQFI